MKPEFFIKNRKKIRSLAKSELLILSANGAMQRNSDVTFPFRQDSNFWYASGVEEPDVLLVMAGEEEYFITPSRSHVQEIMDEPVDVKKMKKVSGIDQILDHKRGWERLTKQIKSSNKVAILQPPEPYVEVYGFYVNPGRQALKNKIEGIKKVGFEDLRPIFSSLRVIKQPEELKLIQKAIDISIQSLNDVIKNRDMYDYEYQIEAALTEGIRSRGAMGHAFPPIVAGGKNATTIHYLSNNDRLDKNGLVLIDFGAEVENYAADIARTITLGTPSERQLEVIEAVKEVQKFAFSILKPGLSFRDYELAVEKKMGSVLKRLGLIKSATREKIRQYFPHATSHFLGLDTHDTGDRYGSVFEPNMVIAVEPSILIAKEGIGVRIEDNVVITKSGIKNLSVNLPSILN
jgi:Xaa-Pro aminopeptidase